jgi:diguanylate cyclase (GGDEF)-like protein
LAAADRLAVAIDNARLYDRMEKMAVTDALTGVYNRLYLHQYLDKLVNDQTPLALAIMDVDHFKKVNDSYGHLSGDTALKMLTAMIKSILPANGLIARYGGEEFVVVLAGGSLEEIMNLAEEIRLGAENLEIIGEGNQDLHITVSLGTSALPELAKTVQGVLHSADQALYRAKEAGRNRVCLGILTEPSEDK